MKIIPKGGGKPVEMDYHSAQAALQAGAREAPPDKNNPDPLVQETVTTNMTADERAAYLRLSLDDRMEVDRKWAADKAERDAKEAAKTATAKVAYDKMSPEQRVAADNAARTAGVRAQTTADAATGARNAAAVNRGQASKAKK